MSRPRVASGVLDAYRTHHPDAEDVDVVVAYAEGCSVERGVGSVILGRARVQPGDECFRLSPDRRGMFISLPSPARIIAYATFQTSQQRFALERYPLALNERRDDELAADVDVEDEAPIPHGSPHPNAQPIIDALVVRLPKGYTASYWRGLVWVRIASAPVAFVNPREKRWWTIGANISSSWGSGADWVDDLADGLVRVLFPGEEAA